MTVLEAVNNILQMSGEAPVNAIPSSGLSQATIAYNTLLDVSKEVQSYGLHCNSETLFPLSPDASGNINLPSNALRVDASDVTRDIVMRGSRLYDRGNHTYTFTAPLDCEVTWYFDFTDLPQHVQKYIQVKAARKFLVETVGDTELYSQTEKMEYESLVNFKRGEMLNGDYSLLDNATVARTIRRRYV